MRFKFVAVLACAAISGCATVESAADHARDLIEAHPVATSVVVSVAASSILTTIAMREAKKQLSDQMAAALAGERSPPQYGALAHP